jgi:sortase (surface protein transpeptidase)
MAAPTAVSPPPASSLTTPSPVPVDPVAVDVPTIGARSELARLGLDDRGQLAAPADYARAGWFAAGPAPGAIGPAVIAGHVDSTTGPAVFYRLRELRLGQPITVTRADGSMVAFAVTEVRQYAKDAFPTADVYGPVPEPELRLITCGGSFDRTRGSYRDNVVVFATLAS